MLLLLFVGNAALDSWAVFLHSLCDFFGGPLLIGSGWGSTILPILIVSRSIKCPSTMLSQKKQLVAAIRQDGFPGLYRYSSLFLWPHLFIIFNDLFLINILHSGRNKNNAYLFLTNWLPFSVAKYVLLPLRSTNLVYTHSLWCPHLIKSHILLIDYSFDGVFREWSDTGGVCWVSATGWRSRC